MGTGHQRGERAGHRPATRCGVLTSPIRVVEGVITGRLRRTRQTGFKGKEVQAGLLTREPWSMSNSASRLGVGVIPRQHQLVTELRPIFNEESPRYRGLTRFWPTMTCFHWSKRKKRKIQQPFLLMKSFLINQHLKQIKDGQKRVKSRC